MFFDKVSNGYTFNDFLLVPNYSETKSRADGDISSSIVDGFDFDIPIVSANMKTVTEEHMISSMHEMGGVGALHRFMSTEQFRGKIVTLNFFGNAKYGFSVGVNIDQIDEWIPICFETIKRDVFLFLDVAHAHSLYVKNALKHIKDKYPCIKVIAGNVATARAAKDLIEWGADSCKIGVGGGSACATRIVSGCGYPQLSAIKEVSRVIKDINRVDNRNIKLISDGGHKTPGDIVKALAAGADFVMLGSLLAGTKEAPGNVLTLENGEKVKLYEGMASCNSQINQFNKEKKDVYSEGVSTFVKYKGSISNILGEITKGVQSGLSYCGCKNIQELQEYGDMESSWVKISNAGYAESIPHISK